jgi:O-antigen/teichoic acid export membrane protein
VDDAGANIRASSAMLLGQVSALAVSFVVQIVVVRHLTKVDYGAFAWALSVVLLLQSVMSLGLDRASARFLAMFDERRDYQRLFGFIAIETTVLLGLGTLVVATTWAVGYGWAPLAPSHRAVTVLLLLVPLAPLQAIDTIVVEMFAVFASPWSVFMRRYVLEPLLRLIVAVLLVTNNQRSYFLAVGYVVVAVAGLTTYLVLLVRLFKRIGLSAHFAPRSFVWPWRETARFCVPLLLTTLVAVATTEGAAIALGLTSGPTAVAQFRAVQPFAALNLVALYSFTTLFTPAIARMAARGSTSGVRLLYWRTALWVATLTFPVMVVTTVFAHQFVDLVLGQRYASSAAVLSVLSVGYYVNAALGYNGLTVQVLGRSTWVFITSCVTLMTAIVALTLLARSFGAPGAAVGVLVTLLVHNALKQAGLGFGLDIHVLDRDHLLMLGRVTVLTLALAAVDAFASPPLWSAIVATFCAWLLLIRWSRHSLQVDSSFPEIVRMPLVRWLLMSSRTDS